MRNCKPFLLIQVSSRLLFFTAMKVFKLPVVNSTLEVWRGG